MFSFLFSSSFFFSFLFNRFFFPFFFPGRYLTPLYAELTRAPLDSDEIELPRFPWWEAYRGQRVHAVRPALLAELISSIQRLRLIVASRKEYRFPKERRLSLIHMFSDATLKQCGVEIVAEGTDTFGLVPTAEGRLRWGATFAEAIHGIPLAAKNTGVTESEPPPVGSSCQDRSGIKTRVSLLALFL